MIESCWPGGSDERQLSQETRDGAAQDRPGGGVHGDEAVEFPGQIAVSLTAPIGVNLSEEDMAAAEKRFAIIEPLISPEKHRRLWLQFEQRRSKVVRFLAGQHNTTERTIYRWTKAWEDGGGLPALVDRDRSDKGTPRAMNAAAMDFLLAASMPRHRRYGELSVRECWRAYGEEKFWRASMPARSSVNSNSANMPGTSTRRGGFSKRHSFQTHRIELLSGGTQGFPRFCVFWGGRETRRSITVSRLSLGGTSLRLSPWTIWCSITACSISFVSKLARQPERRSLW